MDSSQSIEISAKVLMDLGSGLVALCSPKKGETQGEATWGIPSDPWNPEWTLEENALFLAERLTGMRIEVLRQFHCYSLPQSAGSRGALTPVLHVRCYGELPREKGGFEWEAIHQMNLPANLSDLDRRILNDFFLERY